MYLSIASINSCKPPEELTGWSCLLAIWAQNKKIMKHLCIQCSFNHWHKVAACKTDSAATVFPGLWADFVQLCLVQGFFQDFRIPWFHCLFEFSGSLHSRPPQNHGFRHNWLATLPCFLHAICNFRQASCAGLKICHKKGDHKTIQLPQKTKTPGVEKTIWWNSGCATLWSYVEPASPRLVSRVFFEINSKSGPKKSIMSLILQSSSRVWVSNEMFPDWFGGPNLWAMITSLKKDMFWGIDSSKTNLHLINEDGDFPIQKIRIPFPASFCYLKQFSIHILNRRNNPWFLNLLVLGFSWSLPPCSGFEACFGDPISRKCLGFQEEESVRILWNGIPVLALVGIQYICQMYVYHM